MSKREVLLKMGLPVLILLIGLALTIVMLKTRQTPHAEEQAFAGPLVEVRTVKSESWPVNVRASGTVQARYHSDVTPQVSGRIAWISPKMVSGERFSQGELLFRIEAVDYQLALERARASLAAADLEQLKIAGQAEIARQEWQQLKPQESADVNPLVLFEPQLTSAKAGMAAARSGVRQAELDLARTELRAPFNCYVSEEQVGLGQYLRAGTRYAILTGTDTFEVVVPLPLEELSWLQIPGPGKLTQGSPATIQLQLSGHSSTWQGKVVRRLGDIDPRTRMASVIVAIDNPLGEGSSVHAQLAPGMFVDVLLHGNPIEQVLALPLSTLSASDNLWLVDSDNRLQIRKVEIARRERDVVLIAAGLNDGERVVVTGLSGAADGMLLRPRATEAGL
mgnify:CR=1 FL=1